MIKHGRGHFVSKSAIGCFFGICRQGWHSLVSGASATNDVFVDLGWETLLVGAIDDLGTASALWLSFKTSLSYTVLGWQARISGCQLNYLTCIEVGHIFAEKVCHGFVCTIEQ